MWVFWVDGDWRILNAMVLPSEKNGSVLKVKGRELEFSHFPMYRTSRRWGLHSMLFAAEPWAVAAGAVNDAKLTSEAQTAGLSFVRQSREYFRAAERAAAIETKPLLFYYSFLNLAKTIAIIRGRAGMVGKVSHGISVVGSSGFSPGSSKVEVQHSGKKSNSVVDELHWAIEGARAPAGQVDIKDLVAQSVVGHKIWQTSAPRMHKERFFAVDYMGWREEAAAHEIRLKLSLTRQYLSSRNRPAADVLKQGGLAAAGFRMVTDAERADEVHSFEQLAGTPYGDRAADVVMDSVQEVRRLLWQTVTSSAPYRRFYLYLSPAGEARLPQWMSVYALFFWLGSLTRYQPVDLLNALEGPYGPFLQEFIQTQPSQLLYLLASEARRQNVSRPAIA